MGVITSPNRPKTDKTIRIKTDKTDKTIRKFVRDHLNRPKVPKVPIFPIVPIAPILALNCKLNPVQTRRIHKKGTAPSQGQLTDTNNLNFTLLIFYTNFYISFSLFLSNLYIINPFFFRQPLSFCGLIFLFLVQIYGEKNNLANQKYLSHHNQNLYRVPNTIRLYDI